MNYPAGDMRALYPEGMTQIAAPAKTNTLALVGFIASFMIPIAGLVLGLMARNQLSVPGNPETGRGLARWAMVIGVLGILFHIAFAIVWVTLFVNTPLVG